MNMQERIRARLSEALAPTALTITDDSAKHAGHVGARPGGETHFHVDLVAAAFEGKSRVQRHRMVYDALRAELADGVHALAVNARAPDEA